MFSHAADQTQTEDSELCTYLCGNSLGLQPVRTREYILKYLDTWATKGVYAHFKELNDSLTSPWVQIDDEGKESMGKILGALPDEIALMETLTANLHLLMASFYKPTKERYKIIIEGKAFPSDHVGRITATTFSYQANMPESMQLYPNLPTTMCLHLL
jgi:kynureninase